MMISAPVTAFLNVTNKCNLACKYCSASATESANNELSYQEMEDLVKQLKEAGLMRVIVTGGELFLRRDIFKILRTLCENHLVSILTNGSLIDDSVARRLAALRLRISVSLDSELSEVNDYLRGPGSFKLTVRGIKNLIKYGMVPNILFTPTKVNYPYFPALVRLIRSWGIRHISINELMPEGRAKSIYGEMVISPIESRRFKKTLKELHQEVPGMITENVAFWSEFPSLFKHTVVKTNFASLKPKNLKACSAATDQIAITSEGWVIPCNAFQELKCGNVREETILNIWKKSQTMESIRLLASVSLAELPICGRCKYNVICHAGCRARAYLIYGDLKAPDPDCPYHPTNLNSTR